MIELSDDFCWVLRFNEHTLNISDLVTIVKADTNDNGKVSGKGKMSEKDRMMEALREHFARAVRLSLI